MLGFSRGNYLEIPTMSQLLTIVTMNHHVDGGLMRALTAFISGSLVRDSSHRPIAALKNICAAVVYKLLVYSLVKFSRSWLSRNRSNTKSIIQKPATMGIASQYPSPFSRTQSWDPPCNTNVNPNGDHNTLYLKP